jgi:aspartate/methionine/tyrosine aminotransferase
MYRFLEFKDQYFLESACEIYPDSITLCGLSKSFALPGLRLGWLATRNKETFRRIQEFKDYTTICSAAPAEILGIMALKARNNILSRNRRLLRENLNLIGDFFLNHREKFSYTAPKGGSICFPELITGQDIEQFADSLRERKGVLLLPSPVYNFPGNFFRLGFGRKNLPLALEKLEEFIQE